MYYVFDFNEARFFWEAVLHFFASLKSKDARKRN